MAGASPARRVFLTGGTGYLGSRLVPLLLDRGHTVRALVRDRGSCTLPPACRLVSGDALDLQSFANHVMDCDTFVQLVGTPKPAPWKGAQFRAVDRRSGLASIEAAKQAGIRHFVYVSVAHPAPIMKVYLAVRMECEAVLRNSGILASILRPWYILGPGHWWPLALVPAYWLCERLPATGDAARRLGLVTVRQMLAALVWAVEHPPEQVRVIEVPDIRRLESETS